MKALEPRVIKEEKDYIVIEKPSGLLVHPTSAKKAEVSLLDFLAKKYPETKTVGDPERAGLVHRLDREVSGVMVVPRTQEMYEHLKTQFKEHTITKHYTALVHGVVGKDEGTINFPIARSRNAARMAARPEGEDGREALTEFTTLRRLIGCSLLDVRIHTGRTHQIRAHLFAYGHPVIGDPLYKRKTTKVKRTPGRIFLHAAKLGFTDLAGKSVVYESAMPKELSDYLSTLT